MNRQFPREKETKNTMFPGDAKLTVNGKNGNSFSNLLLTIEIFSKVPELKLNIRKSTFLRIAPLTYTTNFFLAKIKKFK